MVESPSVSQTSSGVCEMTTIGRVSVSINSFGGGHGVPPFAACVVIVRVRVRNSRLGTVVPSVGTTGVQPDLKLHPETTQLIGGGGGIVNVRATRVSFPATSLA